MIKDSFMRNGVENGTAMMVKGSEQKQKERLGEILVRLGMITSEQLSDALQAGKSENKLLGQVLVEKGTISTQDLAMALSIQLKVPLIDLSRHKVNPEALKKVPEELSRKYKVLPADIIGHSLVLVMENIQDVQAIDDIAFVSKMRVEPMMGYPDEIRKAIDRNYSMGNLEVDYDDTIIKEQAEEKEVLGFEDEASQAPAMRNLNTLIQQAVRSRASDILIEPQEKHVQVRFRIDGVLHEKGTLPLSLHPALLSRLKIISGMNIAERRRPQDGRFSAKIDKDEVDVRVGCGPAVHGEMAALRLLSRSSQLLDLHGLGISDEVFPTVENLLKLPFGMILLGGPTGSGKTTTLYAAINKLDRMGRNIMTIEDPVEYDFDGINQFQVNVKAGMTFATGLRAFMRMDPDVILVGEVRDNETAKIAAQAALTGHLVFSSIHANDAVGVIHRLLDLGVEPFIVCSTVTGAIAQRVVRRICPNCKKSYKPTVEEQAVYETYMGEIPSELYKGEGCNVCSDTGYSGRVGVYEVMLITDEIKRLILARAPVGDIHSKALEQGMVPLMKDGIVKVKEGVTTISEILKQVYSISSY